MIINGITYLPCHAHEEIHSLPRQVVLGGMAYGRQTWKMAQAAGRQEKKAADDLDGDYIQELGDVGERVVRKALGLPMLSVRNTFKGADLPYDIEVRVSGEDCYGCRVRDDDKGFKRVVEVIILKGREFGPYRIPGWIYARDAKRPEWRMDPNSKKRPMYAVPQEYLLPLSELRILMGLEFTLSTCVGL